MEFTGSYGIALFYVDVAATALRLAAHTLAHSHSALGAYYRMP
jgi:hypothetical protein